MHYARVMIEPGMELAGTPLTAEQRETLDYLDEVLERPELNTRSRLEAGDLLDWSSTTSRCSTGVRPSSPERRGSAT